MSSTKKTKLVLSLAVVQEVNNGTLTTEYFHQSGTFAVGFSADRDSDGKVRAAVGEWLTRMINGAYDRIDQNEATE